MKKLLKSFLFLSVCPDYPTIPTTSSPMLITSNSPGISHFPSPTQQLSITMVITPDVVCQSGLDYYFFSMDITPSGGGTQQYFSASIRCSTLAFRSTTTFMSSTSFYNAFPSGLGPIALLLSFDLSAQTYIYELRSEYSRISSGDLITVSGLTFDSNSKFYLCANQDGNAVQACTVSKFFFEYRYYGAVALPYNHLAGDPDIVAFYPLSGGSLATSIGSASPAYFGDKESSPTESTKPTWDSSNNFIKITAGQFLTFPLPDISSTLPTTSYDFSFSAWVKILTPIPSATTTIFAMYSSTGDQVGYYLTVDQSTRELSMAFKSDTLTLTASGTAPTIALDTWQLIGFAASSNTDKKSVTGTVFCETSSYDFYFTKAASAYDLSTAAVIRIGDAIDSFNGHTSIVRIISPGGGFIRSTDVCSPDNRIELGVGSFTLACSGDKILNPADNTCIDSCANNVYKVTDTGAPLCVACSEHCASCDSTGCLDCETDYLKYDGGCVKPCPDKTYSDGTACKDCSDTNCKACDSTKCSACNTGYLLSKGGCVSSCPAKSYSDDTSCIDHCTECSSSGCKACEAGYKLNGEKKCVSKSSPTTPTSPTTPSTPSKEEAGLSSGGGISGGAIAGIVCGSVAIILLAGCCVFGFKRKKFPFRQKSCPQNPYVMTKSPPGIEASNPVSPVQTEENQLVP